VSTPFISLFLYKLSWFLKGQSHRFVEETVLRTLVLLARTVVESVAEAAVVDTAEAAPPVRARARKPLRLVRGPRTLCTTKRKYSYFFSYFCNLPFLLPLVILYFSLIFILLQSYCTRFLARVLSRLLFAYSGSIWNRKESTGYSKQFSRIQNFFIPRILCTFKFLHARPIDMRVSERKLIRNYI
jgi:hypothetical protein